MTSHVLNLRLAHGVASGLLLVTAAIGAQGLPAPKRRIVLDRVKTVSATPERARALVRNCDPSTPGKGNR